MANRTFVFVESLLSNLSPLVTVFVGRGTTSVAIQFHSSDYGPIRIAGLLSFPPIVTNHWYAETRKNLAFVKLNPGQPDQKTREQQSVSPGLHYDAEWMMTNGVCVWN